MEYKTTRAALGRSPFIEVEKNVRLHITDLGEGDPLVLIHGLPFSSAMFEYQYQYFIKAGYRVIGISLRGFGLSDKPYGRYNYDVFADDIKIVFEDLEIENAVLCGFSTGAAVAIRYAVRYNAAHIDKLVLFSPATPFLAKEGDLESGLLRQHANRLIDLINANRPEFFKTFTRLTAGEDQFITSHFTQWLSYTHGYASSYAIEQCLIMLRDADLCDDLKRINIYTAIFHGKKDKLSPFNLAERLQDIIPLSWFVPFEYSGHAVFLDEMEKFNSALLKFLHFSSIKSTRPVFAY
jgi:non-heme chloroperoxidase